MLNAQKPERSFSVVRRKEYVSLFPFTPESAPLMLTAKARKILGLTVDRYGLCGVLPQSPVTTTEPFEAVTLVPMGTARLRVSAFSVVK